MTLARSFTARETTTEVQRSVIAKATTWLVVAAWLFLAMSPVLEARFGADARPHVEVAGTNLHHAHNPADCATCAARAMLAVPDRAGAPEMPSLRPTPPALPGRDEYLDFLRESNSRPRAPPLRQT